VTAKDILVVIVIPLALAEIGPWCGWIAERLLPWAVRLRYGDTDRAVVRLEEWSGDLSNIPGQLTKLAYAVGQLATGTAVSAVRSAKSARRKIRAQSAGETAILEIPVGLGVRTVIRDGFSALPSSQRQVLIHCTSGNLTDTQIALKMGISKREVKRHMRQGISTLRAAVEASLHDQD
jgi:Sigma-70, region 4